MCVFAKNLLGPSELMSKQLIHRVSRFRPASKLHIYRRQSPPIPLGTSLYHLQKSINHCYCIWRGAVVWWKGQLLDPSFVRPHGPQLHCCRLG